MDSTATIRELNDAFRTAFAGQGRVFVTAGIAALPPDDQAEIMRRVHAFDDFSPDNDPYGEHDFGSLDYVGKTIFWKIDCYDHTLNYGSPDPVGPERDDACSQSHACGRILIRLRPAPPQRVVGFAVASLACRSPARILRVTPLSWRQRMLTFKDKGAGCNVDAGGMHAACVVYPSSDQRQYCLHPD